MAASNGKKWIIRDERGHIYGPFVLEKLKELLRRGVLTGEEQSAVYPAGDWRPMSADPELYDMVIDALAKPQETRASASGGGPATRPGLSTQSKSKEPTRTELDDPYAWQKKAQVKTRLLTEDELAPNLRPPTLDEDKDDEDKDDEGNAERTQKTKTCQSTAPDIELTRTEVLKQRAGNLLPAILVLLAIGFLVYAQLFRGPVVHHYETINLIYPRVDTHKQPDPQRSDAFLRQGWTHFYSDQFSQYLKAEDEFVGAVEASPANSEAILMLLMTDLQLWPFAKQDGSDVALVQSLMEMLSKTDLYGTRRAVGAAIGEIMLNQDSSARSQVDSALNLAPTEGRLYALKGDLFFQSAQWDAAYEYYDQASQLLSHWAKPLYVMAVAKEKAGHYSDAEDLLNKLLQMNPHHAAARLELGIIEGQNFNHDDRARELISDALDSDEHFIPSVEAQGHFVLANLLFKSGHRSRAKAEAEVALKLSPNDPDIRELLARLGSDESFDDNSGDDRQHMALGDQYMRSNNYLGAQAQYKAAFLLNPHNARAAVAAADALWKLHQASDAMDYLQRAISADGKYIEAYVKLADYKGQRFDFDGAARTLDAAVKADPKSYEIYRGYAELYLRSLDTDSAETYANRALGLYETDVKTNELMARIQLEKKNIVKAVQYARRAIELDRSDMSAQVNYAKVKAAYEGVAQAVGYLKDLINTYPSKVELRVGLAEILYKDEEYSSAIEVLNQVLNGDDMNKDAYLLMGDAQFSANSLDDALNSYFAASRIDPSDPSGVFRAGEVYLKAGHFSDAEKEFRLVLKINPLFPRAHYNLARALASLSLGDQALKELDEEKRQNPRLADPWEYAGDLQFAARKFSEAVKEYQHASELKPQSAEIYVKLARAYRAQGLVDAAAAMLRLATAKESGYAEIYKEYGYLYEEKGMAQEAVDNFNEYLRLEPNAPDKDVIDGKVKQLQ